MPMELVRRNDHQKVPLYLEIQSVRLAEKRIKAGEGQTGQVRKWKYLAALQESAVTISDKGRRLGEVRSTDQQQSEVRTTDPRLDKTQKLHWLVQEGKPEKSEVPSPAGLILAEDEMGWWESMKRVRGEKGQQVMQSSVQGCEDFCTQGPLKSQQWSRGQLLENRLHRTNQT